MLMEKEALTTVLTSEEVAMMAPAKQEFADVEYVQDAQTPAELLEALYRLWHEKITDRSKSLTQRNSDCVPAHNAHKALKARMIG